jgi:hypothetical protein
MSAKEVVTSNGRRASRFRGDVPISASLAERGAECRGVGHDGVAGKAKRLAALRRIGMAGAAGNAAQRAGSLSIVIIRESG